MPEEANNSSLKILLLGSQMATGGRSASCWTRGAGLPRMGTQFTQRSGTTAKGLCEQYRKECAFPVIDLEAWRSGSGLANPFRLAGGLLRLYRLMRRERYQVIETFTHHANLLGLPAAWLARLPVRVAGHHGRIEQLPAWITRLHTRVINSRITSILVAVSTRVQKIATDEEGVAPEKIVVIPNRHASRNPAQPIEGTRSRYRQEIGLDDGGLLVLSVGRLVEQKGHIYLLEAIPAIVEQFPKTVFAIAGDGSQRAELEIRCEQLGISPSVRFLGTRSDVSELLQVADVFVLPSLWEGFPIALTRSHGSRFTGDRYAGRRRGRNRH